MCRELLSVTNELRSALENYDEARGRELFERFADGFGADVVAAELVPLLLRIVARRTRCDRLSVAQGEFIRGALVEFLLRCARGWAQGRGPRAVLASTPGVQREAALIGFGLALRRRGWRINYLGVDVPFAILLDSVRKLRPRLVVLSVPKGLAPRWWAPEVRGLGDWAPIALLGASQALGDALGARVIGTDLIAEARRVSIAATPRYPLPD